MAPCPTWDNFQNVAGVLGAVKLICVYEGGCMALDICQNP